MILLLTFCIDTLFKEQSRKKNILEFCLAYVKLNHYNLSKYIPKRQRLVVLEWFDRNSHELNHLNQLTNTNLKHIVIELFSQRPSEISYVTVLLEYVIIQYTKTENEPIDTCIEKISNILYSHSEFEPKRRYNDLMCRVLFFFQML